MLKAADAGQWPQSAWGSGGKDAVEDWRSWSQWNQKAQGEWKDWKGGWKDWNGAGAARAIPIFPTSSLPVLPFSSVIRNVIASTAPGRLRPLPCVCCLGVPPLVLRSPVAASVTFLRPLVPTHTASSRLPLRRTNPAAPG
jgi:hypothetical protein